MSDTTRNRLWESFAEASGGDRQSWHDVTNATAELVNSAGMYAGTANMAGANVQGLPLSGDEAGSTAESAASAFFESGFGVAALVKGLMGLFGGETPQQPLEKYEMPAPIDFESAETNAGLSVGSFDQTGRMRAIGGNASAGTSSGAEMAASPPQITVQVQAMDAQSFLDHSDDIAQAVRGAMLSMASINDVVNEL